MWVLSWAVVAAGRIVQTNEKGFLSGAVNAHATLPTFMGAMSMSAMKKSSKVSCAACTACSHQEVARGSSGESSLMSHALVLIEKAGVCCNCRCMECPDVNMVWTTSKVVPLLAVPFCLPLLLHVSQNNRRSTL
jgi:hypothetical protein